MHHPSQPGFEPVETNEDPEPCELCGSPSPADEPCLHPTVEWEAFDRWGVKP